MNKKEKTRVLLPFIGALIMVAGCLPGVPFNDYIYILGIVVFGSSYLIKKDKTWKN